MNNGAFGENFPYSNFHDLNMDWIIKIAKDFLDQYTHIQEIIEQGKTDIQELTDSGLEQLQEKADNLEELLQEWYNEHSEDIANQLASALADLNTWYNEHSEDIANALANALDTISSTLQTETASSLAYLYQQADIKLANTLASIPDDYTALGKSVTNIIHETPLTILSDIGEFTFTVFSIAQNRIQSKILYFPFRTTFEMEDTWQLAYDVYTPDATNNKLSVSDYTNFLDFPVTVNAGWYVLKARKKDDSALSSTDITYFGNNCKYTNRLKNSAQYKMLIDTSKYFTFSNGTILQTLPITFDNEIRIDYYGMKFAFDKLDSNGDIEAWTDWNNDIRYLGKGKYNLKFQKQNASAFTITEIEELITNIKITYDLNDNALKFKTMAVIGDSLVANHNDPVSYTWHYRLAKENNMPYTNLGINGDPLVYDGIVDKTPVVDRLNTIPNGTDYIIIIGGENDRNYQLPIADFKAGLNNIIDYLNTNMPKAKICFITPWKQDYDQFAIPIDNYIDAIQEVCDSRSVPCFNSGNESGIYMTSPYFRNAYCQGANDESHLNFDGHTRFLSRMRQFIMGL